MFLNGLFQNISALTTIRSTPHWLRPLWSSGGFHGERKMTATLRNLEGQDEASILREIHSALNGLKFGSVEITVHNGQVVQIERKEKFRLQPSPGKNT